MKTITNILLQDTSYLDTLKNRILTVSFLSVFTIVFLTVYAPFDMSEWDGNIQGHMSIGCGVIIISQLVLRSSLKFQKLKLYQLVLWIASEIFVIAFLIYLIFGPTFPTLKGKVYELWITLRYVFLILAGPYVLFIWHRSVQQKFSAQPTATFENNTASNLNNELLTIKSENNKVLLAINYEQLLYIKSSGNYLEVYYLIGQEVTKALIRIRLKELEASLNNSDMLRIHRSYIVNKHKISSFKKNRKAYGLILQHASDLVLPVSTGYKDKFEKALNLQMSH